MNRIFADTFYWLALSSPTDQWRTSVLKAIATLDHLSIVTTEEVLTEFLARKASPLFSPMNITLLKRALLSSSQRDEQ